MDYVVAAGLEPPVETTELDALQREGVAALLDRQLGLVEGVAGPDDKDIDVLDYRITVHPDGATVVFALDAPSLRAAEEATATVMDELLRESDLLAGWMVTESKVQITEDEFNLSLAAAEGTSEIADVEAALEAAVEEAMEIAEEAGEKPPLDTEHWREKLTSLAPRLKAFDLTVFSDQEPAARLASGALIHAVRVVTDEIFYDELALSVNNASADHAVGLLVLEELPACYEHRYNSVFARSFLLASAAVASHLTESEWIPPRCVAEALALHLIINEARVVLEAAELMNWEDSQPLFAGFAGQAFASSAYEQLYEVNVPLVAGENEVPAEQIAAIENQLRTRGLDFESWFTPTDDTGQHPYLA